MASSLDPGDSIEYGSTVEIDAGSGIKVWLRVGATSTVREGETANEARRRIVRWVDDFQEKEIQRRVSSANVNRRRRATTRRK